MKTWIRTVLSTMTSGWEKFFFAPQPALPLALFRFAFGLTAFVMYAVRFTHWREYFTEQSFLPASAAFEILGEFYLPSIAFYPRTDSAAFAMNVSLLISLGTLTIGFFPRISALVAFVMHVALIQRNYAIAYGADFISTFFLFSLIFCQSSLRFSVTSLLKARRGISSSAVEGTLSQIISSAMTRVLQIQLCLIYAYTGLEKMKGASWWDGTAVWAVLGNRQLLFLDFSWLRSAPLLIALMTFSTVLFEIYFAVLVWIPKLRPRILALGVMMHLGIAVSIGLVYFSLVMMTSYFTFASVSFLERLGSKCRISPNWMGVEPSLRPNSV